MNEESQKEKPSCLKVLVTLGAILGALLAIITGLNNLVELLLKLPQHFVIQISGFQISIGITVIIALLILLLMGLAFTMGMFYIMFVVAAVFTKQGIPLFIRPFAVLAYPFLYLANWISEWKLEAYRKHHPQSSGLSKRLKEEKSDTSSNNH